MLTIKDLHAKINNKEILKGLNLSVGAGEVHAIMGPNGSGKSTLSYVLAGKPGYEVTKGEITFEGQNLNDLNPEQRARKGLFLAFQYPVEVPGVNNLYFLKSAYNALRKNQGKSELDAMDFLKYAKEKAALVKLDDKFLNRPVNEGFSGGEKKRNEIFQLAVLDPKLAILDETDSGLDIDSLKIVSEGINALKNKNRSIVLITHYQRLLDYITPDFVHVLSKGKIIKSGTKELAKDLEKKGYGWIEQQPSA